MWIFAYGSLIFRPGFAYLERRVAWTNGYARRFWQASPDHRGTPEAPGRVATLIEQAGAWCGGCAYRIEASTADEVFAVLDAREQAGFSRVRTPVHETERGPAFAEATTYVAHTSNPHFLGPMPEEEIAAWVRARRGPSGENAAYVLALAEALEALGVRDDHVARIAAHVAVRPA